MKLPECCSADIVNCFYNPMQSSVSPYRHVCSTEIVVNGTDHSNNIQVTVLDDFIVINFT